MTAVEGNFSERFRPVTDVFAGHLASGADVGAALSLYVDGHKEVDVWGGIADPATGTEWTEHTLVPVFSCSKGVLTICALTLVDDGRLELDAPAARYWAEFAAAGKDRITVEHVLSHSAGLPIVDAHLTLDEVLDWNPVIAALESQAPLWESGTSYAYHALTFGWLVGELVRRVTGSSPGRFLRSQWAEPLGLDTWIGLPESEHHRVATLLASPAEWTAPEVAQMVQRYLHHDDRSIRAATVNGALRVPFPGGGTECSLNDPDVRSHELPAGNCITDARSLAKLYASTLGAVDGRQPILSPELRTDASTVRTTGEPFFGLPGVDNKWGLGFQLPSSSRPMLGASSYGHDGAGGELAFADHDAGVGFAYVHNQMGGIPDNRANALVDAVRSCLL